VQALAPDLANGTAVQAHTKEPVKKRRNKMSFSTPGPQEAAPVRRSKRLSDERNAQLDSPLPKAQKKERSRAPVQAAEKPQSPHQPREDQPLLPLSVAKRRQDAEPTTGSDHSATKIALPFADTPVIRRNKAMRENKSGKGERRSSLGMRGRRASSLIETGNSNALPHAEVDLPDFYKHIESDGLPEPRRMRQLLTWCATRAMDQKPVGQDFEDASAVAAARVIEEELLRELSSRSELSDWFAREDVPVPPKIIPERPNPKNQQNSEKIVELEEQIKRSVYRIVYSGVLS
jgi:kinetochore protein Mis13/DSN1